MSTVFWSWQSDQPKRETRSLIREALLEAIGRISADLEEADRPEIDHDTRGVPGTPDIVATILAKIDAAAVFVADVTPIAVSEGRKHLSNPNVLIELGYAKRALGPDRVIMVWNTAFTDSRPEDLPFDMRHRRGPLTYSLPANASTPAYRAARNDLSGRLETAIRSSLGTVPVEPAPAVPWQASEPSDASIWANAAAPLRVNRGHLDGSINITLDVGARGFARLIPTRWDPSPNALAILESGTSHPIPLGGYGGINWGPTKGGFLVYRSNTSIEANGVTPTATRWFRETGEFWGVASTFFDEHEGRRVLATGYAVHQWYVWLKHTLRVAAMVGGRGPFICRLGIEGLEGAQWPDIRRVRDAHTEAFEERISHEFNLADDGDEIILAAVEAAFAKVANAFGLQPVTRTNFLELVRAN